jgi:hypothetical protein
VRFCVEINISAPRPCFQLKLGHDLREIHSTVSREQHLTPTARDPDLKHKLNFDVHAGMLKLHEKELESQKNLTV